MPRPAVQSTGTAEESSSRSLSRLFVVCFGDGSLKEHLANVLLGVIGVLETVARFLEYASGGLVPHGIEDEFAHGLGLGPVLCHGDILIQSVPYGIETISLNDFLLGKNI